MHIWGSENVRKCLILFNFLTPILQEPNSLYILCSSTSTRILPSHQQPTLYDFTVSHNAMLLMLTASSSVGNARNRCEKLQHCASVSTKWALICSQDPDLKMWKYKSKMGCIYCCIIFACIIFWKVVFCNNKLRFVFPQMQLTSFDSPEEEKKDVFAC